MLIGGGNSKNQVDCSSFLVFQGRNRYTEACKAKVDKSKNSIQFEFGTQICEIQLEIVSSNQAIIRLKAFPCKETTTAIKATLTIYNMIGKSVIIGESEEHILDKERELVKTVNKEDTNFRFTDFSLKFVDTEAVIKWPIYPFNPYVINNVPEDKNIFITFTTDLDPKGQTKEIHLKIND